MDQPYYLVDWEFCGLHACEIWVCCGWDGGSITDLQFVDDYILFRGEEVAFVMRILSCFQLSLGLKANSSKSMVVELGVHRVVSHLMAECLCCRVVGDLYYILGL